MMLKRWQIAVQGHETGTIVPLDFATFWSRHGAARWVCANPSDFIDLTSYTVVRRAKKNGPPVRHPDMEQGTETGGPDGKDW